MQKFKLLKDFESPYGTVRSGVIKTAQEWADFFSMPEADIFKKRDWFLLIDKDKYLNIDIVYLSELKECYPNLLYTIQVDFPNLTNGEICKIASYVLGTCSWCHNENTDCVCGRDE